jgi:hypothetical protein
VAPTLSVSRSDKRNLLCAAGRNAMPHVAARFIKSLLCLRHPDWARATRDWALRISRNAAKVNSQVA